MLETKNKISSHNNLTFDHICPEWSRKLDNGFSKEDAHILGHDSKYCIVGEAWGYSGRQAGYYLAPLIPFIGCWRCIRIGRDMGKIAKMHGTLSSKYLQPMISDFVEHWNKKHRNLTK